MSIFNNKKETPLIVQKKPQKNTPYKPHPPKERAELSDLVISEQMEAVEEHFDFASIQDERLAIFAKLLIVYGGNGTAAIQFMTKGNKSISYGHQRSLASKYLRELRSHKNFLDIVGLGYNDLIQTVELLKVTKPEKAIDIMMKLNKEDVEHVSHSGTISIAFEEDLD